MKNKFNALGILVLLALVSSALLAIPKEPEPVTFKELPRFESYDDLVAAFEEGKNQGGYYGIAKSIGAVISMPMTMNKATVESVSSEAPGRSDVSGGIDYSTTNIQVEGVDEADIVKTDGRYIYNFSSRRLIITDAYPIENAAIVSKTELQNLYPTEMFVRGNKLLLFGQKSDHYENNYEKGYYCKLGGTVVQLYDISNRAAPALEKELEFEGSYLTSRLIGKHAYFVVNSWPRSPVCEREGECIIPLMVEDGKEKKVAEATDIGHIPGMPAQNFVTLASINLETEEVEKETIAGSAQSVYASQGSIYIAATVWVAPETPIVKDIERAIVGDSEKTVINKFGLADGKIGYIGQGSVPGHVLNQFSMDEFQGNFRIATTLGHVSRMGSQSQNNLYVLDGEMNVIGSLEGLAPGEKIYSARFMGKRAYMVTFKKVDPLFVIDVSDPENPKVLGKLKIPGYSDYLHPIDENHIIGLGKDTIEASKGNFAWYQGIKMAIFDVSDVENPIEVHKVVIGDRGTESPALHDHKAFLYDKEKELLVLPVMLAEIQNRGEVGDESVSPSRGEPTFQGALVYRVSLEEGFEERGRITHVTREDELKRGYYFGNKYSVKRSLYIGNVLYTLSEKMLKANALDTLEDLKEFSFN